MPETDELLTPAEVAADLRIDVRSVYKLFKNGKLRYLDLGHRTKRVYRSVLEKYKESLACN